MKLSTRTRYGVRLMLDLACRHGEGLVYLGDIAAREGISEKYLSQIVIPLRKGGLVRSERGARGGYSLARPASRITLREIVEPLGGITLADCIGDSSACERAGACAARDAWTMLRERMSEALQSITLEDLAGIKRKKRENSEE